MTESPSLLEYDVARLKSDITDLNSRSRSLDDKIEKLARKMDRKFEKAFNVTALSVYIAICAILLGALAKGFKWI